MRPRDYGEEKGVHGSKDGGNGEIIGLGDTCNLHPKAPPRP